MAEDKLIPIKNKINEINNFVDNQEEVPLEKRKEYKNTLDKLSEKLVEINKQIEQEKSEIRQEQNKWLELEKNIDDLPKDLETQLKNLPAEIQELDNRLLPKATGKKKESKAEWKYAEGFLW